MKKLLSIFLLQMVLMAPGYGQGLEKAFMAQAYENENLFERGCALIEAGEYAEGVATLERANYDRLGRYVQAKFRYCHGYGKMMLEDFVFAESDFESLMAEEEFRNRAIYYYGYCLYRQGKYTEALQVFDEHDCSQFSESIPYYILQMHYALGDTQWAYQEGLRLIEERPNDANNYEVYRILGEICYSHGQYAKAQQYLFFYLNTENPLRLDQYILGRSLYLTKDYGRSIEVLKTIPQMQDTISESAYMTMAQAQLKLNKIANAKMTFQAAREMAVTPAIREEAAYNYAVCAYQTSTAFGEGVTAINDFLEQYPNSVHREEIYSLLGEAYMQSKNYAVSLKMLMQVANPSEEILKMRQYLRYQLGTDAYSQTNWTDCEKWMSQLIDNPVSEANPDPNGFITEAYYWRAEARYNQQNYVGAESDLLAFMDLDKQMQTANYRSAQYLLGYSRFAQQHYTMALQAFLPILDQKASDDIYVDAQCRIGDCYFNARDFDHAIEHYTVVSNSVSSQADYALYHIGYAQGLQRRYRSKAESLKALVDRFPESPLADKALYERARALLSLKDTQGAIQAYTYILDKYPTSALAPKASVECGMLYRNIHKDEKAIAAYKRTIASYPGTEEAYTALESLEQLYVTLNRTNEYMEYTRSLADKQMKVEVNADSLAQASAEYQFRQGNRSPEICAKMLELYDIRSAIGAEAHYCLAEQAWQQGDTTKAETMVNNFVESDSQQQYWLAKSLVLLADMQAARGDYFLAQQYLLMLEQNYTSDEELLKIVRERLEQLSDKL